MKGSDPSGFSTDASASARSDVDTRVWAMMADVLGIDPTMITPALELGAVTAWDSIGHLNLMLEMETRFQVDVSPDMIGKLLSVAKICTWLEKHGR